MASYIIYYIRSAMLHTFTLASSPSRLPFSRNKWLWLAAGLFLFSWVNSIIGTTDLNNWIIENMMTLVAIAFVVITYKYYRFSDLSLCLISVYISLHVYGSKYTYAENPFGYWMKEVFGFQRNHYDRLVHFSQGFLLAFPLREMLIHWFKFPQKSGWVMPLVFSLASSALYELLEWGVADVFFPEQGPAYLGLQGDVWDAQKDTFVAGLGAFIATSVISAINVLLVKKGNKACV